MNRVVIALLACLLAVPCVVAQEGEPKIEVDPGIKLMALYDTPGRAWSYRNITWTRGDSPHVESERVEVESIADGQAKVVSSTSDDWGNSSRSTKTLRLDNISDALREMADNKLPKQIVDMGFRKFECTRIRLERGNTHTTTWVSTEFHPLVVKQTVFSGDDHVIKKLTSFDDGKVDPWLLYRKVGRKWTWKMKSGDNENAEITLQSHTVTELLNNGAVVQVRETDEEGDELDTRSVIYDFDAASAAISELDSDHKSSTCESPAGSFDCVLTELAPDAQVWSSRAWPGLMVAYKSPELQVELIEFDLGHDPHEFYRTVGNSYTQTSTTRVAGFTMVQTMKYEVTKIDGASCTYTMKSIDQNGRVVSSSELTHTLPETSEGEEPPPVCPYTDQVEELVHTPVGSFPALRTETGDIVLWMWNGLTIRLEMSGDDVEMIQELTELNIQ